MTLLNGTAIYYPPSAAGNPGEGRGETQDRGRPQRLWQLEPNSLSSFGSGKHCSQSLSNLNVLTMICVNFWQFAFGLPEDHHSINGTRSTTTEEPMHLNVRFFLMDNLIVNRPVIWGKMRSRRSRGLRVKAITTGNGGRPGRDSLWDFTTQPHRSLAPYLIVQFYYSHLCLVLRTARINCIARSRT